MKNCSFALHDVDLATFVMRVMKWRGQTYLEKVPGGFNAVMADGSTIKVAECVYCRRSAVCGIKKWHNHLRQMH